jgi:ribonuclease D
MSSVLPPPVWVAQPEALQRLVRDLAHQPRLAVDTESNSLHAYREQVCLIQFSTSRTDYLVDPLTLADLSLLAPIFANPKIEKVFHAVEYDLICLRRDFGFSVVNLFDTMQAGRILGYKQVGLDSILAQQLDIHLDKRYQKADWGERPLSPEMLSYARLDTHYLLKLRDSLRSELRTRKRLDLAREEFVRLARGNGNGSGRRDLPAWQRVSGKQKLNDRQLAILQELCAWREQQAERLDRPPFKVLDDRRLVAIASAAPASTEKLAQFLTERQRHHFGSDVLRAVSRGKQAVPLSRPRPKRPDQAYVQRLDILSGWRKNQAQQTGLESDIILPKSWMQAIAERNPQNTAELAALMPESPWRLKHYGEEILAAIGRAKK